MARLTALFYLGIGLMAGLLLGTCLFMLCFGPFGFLFPISHRLAPGTLERLDAVPGGPLALAMLASGLLLTRWAWRRAPFSRWLIVTSAVVTGIPSTMWILLVFSMGRAVPNFGFGG